MTPTFNLLDEPWIKVIRLDGSVDELSLLRLFREVEDISQIRGEIASQDVAILRLLLAICHRTMQGPEDLSTWKRYWKDPQLLGVDAASYLERYRDRFDLRHPTHPFFQVAGLKAAPGSTESYSLGEMIGDLPKPEKRLFTQRIFPEETILPWGEAARWLIHLHGFDGPGTHSGALGDPNKKSRYAKAGFLGEIGSVYIKGKNLLETMLLNTVPAKELNGGNLIADKPPWEREQDDHRGKISKPLTGPATCCTWQSRRVLITGDNSGANRFFFSNGDEAELTNGFNSESMTAWKLNGKIFTPERPSQSVAAWRRLPSFLPQRVAEEKKIIYHQEWFHSTAR